VSTVRESTIEAAIVRRAKAAGWLAYKFSSPSRRGVPDRIFIHRSGVLAFMEIKAPGKKLTPLQSQELERLRSHKQNVAWFDSVDNAMEWLNAIVGA
jgi:hypothetical protein